MLLSFGSRALTRGRNAAQTLPSLTPLSPSAPPFSFKHNRLPVVKLAFACVGSRHPSCSMRRPAEPRHSSAPATAPPLPFVHCVFVTFRHNCQCRPSHLHPAPPPDTRSVSAAALHPVSCLSLLLLHLPFPFTPSGGRVTRRSLTRVASLRRAPPYVMRQLASGAVFAVAVAAEFPGRKRDETASSTCAARRYPPSFAASWSSSNALSQTWSAASCAVVTSLPLAFPLRRITHPPVHSVVNAHLSPQTVALCGPGLLFVYFRELYADSGRSRAFMSRAPLPRESGAVAVAGVAPPPPVADAVVSVAFPPICHRILLLCWALDQRGCMPVMSCARVPIAAAFAAVSAVRPRVASISASSGGFQLCAVDGPSSAFCSTHRERSVINKAASIACVNDGSAPCPTQVSEWCTCSSSGR